LKKTKEIVLDKTTPVTEVLDETTSVASSSKVTLDNTKVFPSKTIIKSMSDKLDQINKAFINIRISINTISISII